MTADCSPSWTSWTIKTYFSFKLLFFVPERKCYTYLIAFLFRKKYAKKSHGFRSFRGLLIHSLVTTRNKEFSSRNFGDQLLKNQIVQKFYLSGQIFDTRFFRLEKQPSSVSNCCKLRRNSFFSSG